MNTTTDKIALITHVNNAANIADAGLLAVDGFKVAITSDKQSFLEEAIETIGNGSVGFLNDSFYIGGLLKTCQKVSCYFKGKIDLLIINVTQVPGENLADLSEVFFTVHCALPYLNPKAIIVLNTGTLSEDSLQLITSERFTSKPTISVYLSGPFLQHDSL